MVNVFFALEIQYFWEIPVDAIKDKFWKIILYVDRVLYLKCLIIINVSASIRTEEINSMANVKELVQLNKSNYWVNVSTVHHLVTIME